MFKLVSVPDCSPLLATVCKCPPILTLSSENAKSCRNVNLQILQSATRRGRGRWGQGDKREKLLSKGKHAYPHQKRSGSESGLAWQSLLLVRTPPDNETCPTAGEPVGPAGLKPNYKLGLKPNCKLGLKPNCKLGLKPNYKHQKLARFSGLAHLSTFAHTQPGERVIKTKKTWSVPMLVCGDG
jgi:hypothetical protein